MTIVVDKSGSFSIKNNGKADKSKVKARILGLFISSSCIIKNHEKNKIKRILPNSEGWKRTPTSIQRVAPPASSPNNRTAISKAITRP